MATFKEIMEKSKAKQAQDSADLVKSFRGTGFNQKVAKGSESAYRRESKQALKSKDTEYAAALATKNFAQDIESDIDAIRRESALQEITLDPSQEAALAGMLSQQYAVLIGAAGTGKTTLTNMFVRVVEKKVGQIDANEARMKTITFSDDNGNTLSERIRVSQDEKSEADYVPSIAFAAYTGRAVQQMKRAVPEEYHKNCSTIHSLLGYAPVEEEIIDEKTGEMRMRKIFRPTFNKDLKLPYSVYIFDEAGMIPIPLWNEFIDACPKGALIYLIGDINQLPPVHGKGVLGYAMTKWPVYELTTIHRQAADNPIIANAHNILNGRLPKQYNKQFDIIGSKFVQDAGSQAALVVRATVKTLYAKGQFNPIIDAIIVPKNKGRLGQLELNDYFVTLFNGEKRDEKSGVIVNKRINIHTGTEHKLLAPQDKVMLLQNDNERGLTNGMIGVIESINLNGKYDDKRAQVDTSGAVSEETIDFNNVSLDAFSLTDESESEAKKEKTRDQRQASHVTTVKFADGKTATFSTAGDYRKLTHAYAFTCHKAQGGEYPTVVIALHSADAIMLTREWLYTAITRARQRVIIIGNDLGLQKAIARQEIKGQTLEEKIRSYQILNEKAADHTTEDFDGNKYPILWEATEIDS